ncbi:hypothetical protein IMY05_C4562000400 [Salix suchowensis]|nr:hypothetical protein IMY05_C4562000400 [Salix suchowensis]
MSKASYGGLDYHLIMIRCLLWDHGSHRSHLLNSNSQVSDERLTRYAKAGLITPINKDAMQHSPLDGSRCSTIDIRSATLGSCTVPFPSRPARRPKALAGEEAVGEETVTLNTDIGGGRRGPSRSRKPWQVWIQSGVQKRRERKWGYFGLTETGTETANSLLMWPMSVAEGDGRTCHPASAYGISGRANKGQAEDKAPGDSEPSTLQQL